MQHAAPRQPRHFSMLREFHLADFFTLGNAACAVGAVFLAMLYLVSGNLTRHRDRLMSDTRNGNLDRPGLSHQRVAWDHLSKLTFGRRGKFTPACPAD